MPAEPLDSMESEEIQEQPAPRRRSLLGRVNLALILVVVVAVECLAASMILPDVRKTAEMVGATIPVPPDEDQADPLAGIDAALDNQVEVDLGQFQFSAYQPLTNTTKRIDLHMWGTINKDEEDVFLELKGACENRLRDQILVIFRSSDAGDLVDGNLGLIKRKVLETSNRILGKPLLTSVIFSDFSYIEQ